MAQPSPLDLLTAAAAKAKLPLAFSGGRWNGPGWERVLAEACSAQFTLLGEDHGAAEIARFAGQLFEALRVAGYDRIFVETSDAAASQIDEALRTGGIARFNHWLGGDSFGIAFFTWREEAEFIARVRQAVPASRRAIFGTDYEPFASRQLAEWLIANAPSDLVRKDARHLLDIVLNRQREAKASRDLTKLFGFAGQRLELTQLAAQWPASDPAGQSILRTLERTAAINGEFASGNRWKSNDLRAKFQRESFLAHWRQALRTGRPPKAMFKYGANHMRRGITGTKVFDLGTLLPELAEEQGSHAYQLLILPGRGSFHAVLNPQSFGTDSAPADSLGQLGLDIFEPLAGDQSSLFDLRALRPLADSRSAPSLNPELVATIHGFDALLVIPGTTASKPLA